MEYGILIQNVGIHALLLHFLLHWVVMATSTCLCNLGGLWDRLLKVIQKVSSTSSGAAAHHHCFA